MGRLRRAIRAIASKVRTKLGRGSKQAADTTINQTSSGSGDNVAGDKTVNVAGDSRTVNTDGGDYREINNSGQYAEGDINNPVVLPSPECTERTGRINNLAGRGIDDPSRFV
ncbi:MAG: hypothetical protein AAF685_18305, partial [Cyanobacteria bacterium P01_C01_bin.89]